MTRRTRSSLEIGFLTFIPITIFAVCALLFFQWAAHIAGPVKTLAQTIRQREIGWGDIESIARQIGLINYGSLPDHVQKSMLDRLAKLYGDDVELVKKIDAQFDWLESQWLSSLYAKELAAARMTDVETSIRAYVQQLGTSPTFMINARHSGLTSTDAILLHSGRALEPIRRQLEQINEVERILVAVRTPVEIAISLGLLGVIWGSWILLLQPHLSQLRRMQEEMAHRERRANTTLASIRDVVIVANSKGDVETINQAASELSGLSLEEAYGKPVSEIFPELAAAATHGSIPAIKASGDGDFSTDQDSTTKIRTRSGALRLFSKSAAPIRYPNGEMDGTVLVFRDVTDIKKQEDHVRHIEKLQALGQLAAGMAHEFNNALAIISGSNEIYARHLTNAKAMDAKSSRYVLTVASIVKRTRTLTEKLLSLARTPEVETGLVDILGLLAETINILRQTSDRTITITLNNRADDDERLLMTGDAAALQSVFLNLGLNSLNAIDGQGAIAVTIELLDAMESQLAHGLEPRLAGYVKIRWSDTGRGIAETDLDRIFEPFFTRRTGKGGNGLGLTIAQRAILTHQGVYDVKSKVGEGTCFTICFPRSAHMLQVSKESRTGRLPSARGRHILLVDDEPAFIAIVREYLEANGYTILIARDGVEAVEQFKLHRNSIAVTVLDINLPRQSGTVSAREIRDIDPDSRIIISTGYIDKFPHRDIADSPYTSVMRKTYELSALVREIERLATIASK